MQLGFIGLGNMGTPIARSLLCAGHWVTVYNRTRARAEALQGRGAHVAERPAEVAGRSGHNIAGFFGRSVWLDRRGRLCYRPASCPKLTPTR